MTSIKGKVVVITGASRGIGKAIADECLSRGAIVIIASRSKPSNSPYPSKGSTVKKNRKAEHIPCDITSGSSIKSLIKKVAFKHGRIDVLINNAAIGLFETLADSRENDVRLVFETNVLAPLRLIQLVLPRMRRQKQGCIVNISSAIAKHSLYHQGVYSSSKAALERITEALAIEEAKNGITALLVVPDRTKTSFRAHALGSKKDTVLPYSLPESDPLRVARIVIDAVEKGKSTCFTSLRSRIFTYGAALLPGLVSRIFTREYLRTGK